MSINWYDRDGNPITMSEAEPLLSDPAHSRVALTTIDSSDPTRCYRVSTVWLGLDHNHSGTGNPILFESMVFDGVDASDYDVRRYSTIEEARTGHAEMVATIAATVPDEVVRHITDDMTEAPADGPTPPIEAGTTEGRR